MDFGKREVIMKASQAIKPTLWYTNSILDCAELAKDSELKQLKELTTETDRLKKEAWKVDQKIAEILDKVNERTKEE